jgi:hypothetical protein
MSIIGTTFSLSVLHYEVHDHLDEVMGRWGDGRFLLVGYFCLGALACLMQTSVIVK